MLCLSLFHTRVQMTLPLEELQAGALAGACSKNCSSIMFGLTPAFPNFVQSESLIPILTSCPPSSLLLSAVHFSR